MLNRVVLVGRLTRDPDLRYTQNGLAVANFNIAISRPYTDQNGERQADFINGVVWRKQAENLATFMKKGNLIGVDGRLQSRTYENKDGKTVFVTEVLAESITYLERKNDEKSTNSQQQPSDDNQVNHTNVPANGNRGYFPRFENNNQMEPIDIPDDDLPF